MAEAAGVDVAARIAWIEGDLATWTPEPGRYDLAVCLYVHVAELVRVDPPAPGPWSRRLLGRDLSAGR